jgi:hypothetical protein
MPIIPALKRPRQEETEGFFVLVLFFEKGFSKKIKRNKKIIETTSGF